MISKKKRKEAKDTIRNQKRQLKKSRQRPKRKKP
jgi:hypothetical protein